MLAGAWRRPPFPPLTISQSQLDELAPLLYASSSAGLGWWRVRETELRHSTSAEVLRQAFQLNSVRATLHEETIRKVFKSLREASIEPLLGKGWLAARLYPLPPLRPYYDIDICVRPSDYNRAQEILDSPAADDCWVDLHEEFSELRGRDIDELFARSRLMPLGDEEIRVLSAEDNLALLAIHLLKHAACRSVWLCDIGAAVESLPADFDWNVCLGRNRTRASWIICAIVLAHELLGARIEAVPRAAQTQKVPAWLIESVLEQWANPLMIDNVPYMYPVPFAHYLKHPKGVLAGLRNRWPNPIKATVSINGRFNSLPRIPYQVGNCVLRAAQFVTRHKSETFSL
jgi:putative nucleotidyltransferase-like protein